jgi:hypothetical protein
MDNPAQPDPDQLADRYFESLERQKRHRRLFWTQIGFVFLLPVVTMMGWLTIVGYHSHHVVIWMRDQRVHFVSHESPFDVYTPYDPNERTVSGGFLVCTNDRLFGSSRIYPRRYAWASVATTSQVVALKPDVTEYTLVINNIPFTIAGAALTSGETRWRLEPNRVLEIDVDRFKYLAP